MPATSRARRGRGALAVAVAVLLAVVLIDIRGLHGIGGDDSKSEVTSAAPPTFGLLEADTTDLASLDASAVSDIAVPARWQELQPTRGGLDRAAGTQLVARIRDVTSRGYRAVLDLGLQYPPRWVFDLPGQTRFVNQYGDVWHGTSSTDVPNSVFNPHVRAAIGSYVAQLGRLLDGASINRVRIGGLLSGELRYPPKDYAGHSGLLWNYDDAAQADSPVPGWRPGSGSADDARAGLDYYFHSLTTYLVWMMKTTRAAFPEPRQEVLFPSWGLRPGMVDEALAAGLHDTTNAEVNGMISDGLDWTAQVAAIVATGIPTNLSSTWLDAPQQGPSVRQIPPIAFLAELAKPYRLPVTGENTGRGGPGALELSVRRVRQYGLTGMMYMSGRLIADGQAGVTLDELTRAATDLRHG